jgi:hypothetical protein
MAREEAVARRLLDSIEEFAAQETLALRTGDYPRALGIQERAAPVIGRLCHLGAGHPPWWTVALGRRLDSVLALRRESQALVAARREELLAESDRLAGARRRLRSIAPAYAGTLASARHSARLNAAV